MQRGETRGRKPRIRAGWGLLVRGKALANRISCAYEEREKAPFSVTLFEPFSGEFVTENVMGAFSL